MMARAQGGATSRSTWRHPTNRQDNTVTIFTEAILLYGLPVPDGHISGARDPHAYLNEVLKDHPGVHYAQAGPYDRHTTYLCTEYYEAEISRYSAGPAVVIAPFDQAGTAERNARLEHAAMDLLIPNHPAPAWYLIASQS